MRPWSNHNLIGRLQTWFTAGNSAVDAPDSLLDCLRVAEDPFWSNHWTLRSAALPKAQPLLGATRLTDLAINVVLPWFWMRALEGQNESLRERAEHYYFAWPRAEDNSVLRLARQRFLGGTTVRSLPGAAAQQGLLQIVRDFCAHSNAICENCQFPGLVRDWSGQ